MYYHCRPIKFVEYGTISPPSSYDVYWDRMYKWLGTHCHFYPQIWLSRSRSSLTGYRSQRTIKKSKRIIGSRQEAKISNDSVLFGFDIIKGFPVSFDHWEIIMGDLCDSDDVKDQNKAIVDSLNSILGYYEEDKEEPEDVMADWVKSGCDLDVFLKDYLFKEVDQVVVPSLNLKVAKKIICHNEKQKKKLRKMGFIEDRIVIKNLKNWR